MIGKRRVIHSLRMNHLHASDFTGFQPYLDTVRMEGRFGQDGLHHTFG
jgi:hypothetical protein